MPKCSECGNDIVSGKGFSYPYLPDDDEMFADFKGKYFCSDGCSKKFTKRVKSKFMPETKWWNPFG